jgi:hypothetical protein
MKRILAIILATALSAFAADVTGNWKATAEGPNGAMERTFTLKADGEKLTGETVSSFAGKSEIREGKIKGDDITFQITVKIQDMELNLDYKGKVINKDEIKFTVEALGNTIEWVAKRQ